MDKSAVKQLIQDFIKSKSDKPTVEQVLSWLPEAYNHLVAKGRITMPFHQFEAAAIMGLTMAHAKQDMMEDEYVG